MTEHAQDTTTTTTTSDVEPTVPATARARRSRRALRALSSGFVVAVVAAVVGGLVEGGAVADAWARWRHAADYTAHPSDAQQLGESYLAAVRSGDSADLLALYHRPVRESCSTADLDREVAESRAAVGDRSWLPRPTVVSESPQGDAMLVRYRYDHGDAGAVLTDLTVAEEDGAWRIVSYPCPAARTPQMWWYGGLGRDVGDMDAALRSYAFTGDTMKCSRLSGELGRWDPTPAPTAELDGAVQAWLGAARHLTFVCQEQHLTRLRGPVDVSTETEAYESAVGELVAALRDAGVEP